jgi:cyclase
MKKRRLIPVILIKNGWVVQSRNFLEFQKIGSPITSVKRCSEWGSDELIFLDISRESAYDLNRDDLNIKNPNSFYDIINEISKICFMPIAVGGGVKNVQQIERMLINGADKVVINSEAQVNPSFIEEAAKKFGSQCIVNSIDVKFNLEKKEYEIYIEKGKIRSKYSLVEWLNIAQKIGVGEIFLNSIDRDGTGSGYDIDLINFVEKKIRIPLISCGGAGNFEHFLFVASKTNTDGIAAANFFQYLDQSIFITKKKLLENKHNFRKAELMEI